MSNRTPLSRTWITVSASRPGSDPISIQAFSRAWVNFKAFDIKFVSIQGFNYL
jgi:hypothetical protein